MLQEIIFLTSLFLFSKLKLKQMKKIKKGEITTIIGLGALIILSLSSLVSSFVLNKKQTTKTKATQNCDCPWPGIKKPDGSCEYGLYDISGQNPYAIDKGHNLDYCLRYDGCVEVNYSESSRNPLGGYGVCRFSNPNVCRRYDFQGGCGGGCNWECCTGGRKIKINGADYDSRLTSLYPNLCQIGGGSGSSGGGSGAGGGSGGNPGGGSSPAGSCASNFQAHQQNRWNNCLLSFSAGACVQRNVPGDPYDGKYFYCNSDGQWGGPCDDAKCGGGGGGGGSGDGGGGGGSRSGGGGGSGSSGGGSSPTIPPSPDQTECEKKGGFCWANKNCDSDPAYYPSTTNLGCKTPEKYCCLPRPTSLPITFPTRPTQSPSPKPTTKPAAPTATNTPIPAAQPAAPTATHTPTPITAIPEGNQVLNLKGTASFFINLSNTQYLNYFNEIFFTNILHPFLTKHESCSLGERISNGCHPFYNVLNINNNSLEIRYDNLERYYNSYGLKQINYTFELNSSVLNDFHYENNFVFPNFYATTYSQNTGKTIDLSQFLRILSFKFKKENNYIYQDGNNITFYVNPYPSLYFYKGQNTEYIDAIEFDKEIRVIYLYNFSELPESIIVDVYYNCAPPDGSQSFSRSKQIIFDNLENTENNGREIILNCSDETL